MQKKKIIKSRTKHKNRKLPWREEQYSNRPECTQMTSLLSDDNQTQYPLQKKKHIKHTTKKLNCSMNLGKFKTLKKNYSLVRENCRRRGHRWRQPWLRPRYSCCQPLYRACRDSPCPQSPWLPTMTARRASWVSRAPHDRRYHHRRLSREKKTLNSGGKTKEMGTCWWEQAEGNEGEMQRRRAPFLWNWSCRIIVRKVWLRDYLAPRKKHAVNNIEFSGN